MLQRSSISRAGRGLALGIGFALWLGSRPGQALPGDIATKFAVNDENPVASIPSLEARNADPLEFGNFLQDLISRAENSFRDEEYKKAIKYYEALARAVPERAISFSRLCASYAGDGQVSIAAANCQKAIALDGARVFDHFRFVNLTLQKPELRPEDVASMDASVLHLRAHAAKTPAKASSAAEPARPPLPPKGTKEYREELKRAFLAKRAERLFGEPDELDPKALGPVAHLPTEVELLACKISVRLKDAARLQRCVGGLTELGVAPKLILPFAWSEALVRGDRARAETLLADARAAGFPEPALAAMSAEQEKTLSATGTFGLLRKWSLVALLSVAVLALSLAGARFVRSRRKVYRPALDASR